MKSSRLNLPILVLLVGVGVLALYCTLGIVGRADDASELSFKRTNAVLLTLVWPMAFALFGLAIGMERRRVFLWTALVLFLAWVVGAGTMQMEYSRGGNYWGILGF